MEKQSQKKGKFVAAAVAGLILASASVGMAADATANQKAEEKVKCEGINSCKGTGACKSSSHECKGMNTCKGKGWVEVSKKECESKKGTVVK